MLFSERQKLVQNYFDPAKTITPVEGTPVRVHFIPFESNEGTQTAEGFSLSSLRTAIPGAAIDERITQNNHFVYPVFMPLNANPDRVIIMLHGLNERRWDKYLAWAHYLAEETGKPVILFPTSFHINRSLPEWLNPRLMNSRAEFRRKNNGGDPHFSTYINLALSERLTDSPERFFLAGLQTACDLRFLLNQIRDGEHPLFRKGTESDFFAYSIGGLLAQVMFISNPDDLMSHSRLFLFCAGSLFSQMNGISRVIIDPAANERIQYYYKNELEETIKKSGVFAEFFTRSQVGMAFRSMIAPDRFRKIREKVFKRQYSQIYAVSLKNDKVIPPGDISSTLMGSSSRLPGNMDVYDFDFPYTHEMPFPLKVSAAVGHVDEAFEKIFRKASVFLS
ncbi:MAG TPA: DUF6051 family protein [Bacteroidales bacterium]|nr:DUF6051 family protein [Bacteroidales bacterium]